MADEQTYAWVHRPEHGGLEQLVLRLLEDGTFFFLQATYHNDWGAKGEQSTRYSGTFEANDSQIVCHATHIKRVHREEDRDWNTKEKKIKHEDCDQTLIFAINRDGSLRCPEDTFEGRELRQEVEPHKGVF